MLDNAAEYVKRRKQVMREIGKDAIAIIASSKEVLRNGDSDYLFRQDSNFYYLTGFNEPDAYLVLIPGRSEGEVILFNRERNPAMEVWTGFRAGQKGACEVYGADQAFPIGDFEAELPRLMENCQRIYYSIGQNMSLDRRIIASFNKVRSQVRGGVVAPAELIHLDKILSEMRLHKSLLEISLMRKAAEISCQAHRQAMEVCRPGMMEYQLEAEMQYIFISQGARAPAYNFIIGSGINSCILHYNDNNARISDGDLVLVDAGAEYGSYAADITRTFPANGRFSPEQRAVYEVVLAAQMAVIEQVKPGLVWDKLQEISNEVLTRGLLDLGLLQGDYATLLAEGAVRKFYMHRIGHWLGMDVHDAGSYRINNQWRQLEPGMVFTVEPGVYIPAESEGVDPKWWNIGVRIEDNILVTDAGYEVLTSHAPKTVAEIEALMALEKQ